MAQLPTGLISHTRKVQSLYKRALRNLESWYDRREVYRYQAVLMRSRFDDNSAVRDLAVATDLLNQGEQELFENTHWHVRKFPESPGGVAHERVAPMPDWVVDYWHPLEKAQYPEYFARREERKRQFVQDYEKRFGKATGMLHH